MKRLILFLIPFFICSVLSADPIRIYDIRGTSQKLDANLTLALNQWRLETISPVQSGTYCNVLVNGNPDRKTVSLTFDDAPDENNTNLILDILKHYEVKASFFMIGAPMNDLNATAVIRANEEGHLVLNHSFTHPHLTACSAEEIVRQLTATSERIQSLTGKYPLLMRPPYGSLNPAVIDTINAQGYTTVLWSLDSLDWAVKEKDEIIHTVLTNVRPGDIILMHSGQSNHATVEALPEIIERLKEDGYTFLALDQMTGLKPYR